MSSLIYMKVLMDYVEGQNKNKTYICLMQDHLYVLPNILPCIFEHPLEEFFDTNYYIPIQFI